MSQFWQGVGEAEERFYKLFISFDDELMNSLEVVFV